MQTDSNGDGIFPVDNCMFSAEDGFGRRCDAISGDIIWLIDHIY